MSKKEAAKYDKQCETVSKDGSGDRNRPIETPWEKEMKIRSLVALVGMAISFASPICAEEKEDVKPFPFIPISAGPQLVQQIETINQKFDEAFNKHDAAAVGEL